MIALYDYTRLRSKFWLKIYTNDGSTNISANSLVKNLIQYVVPGLIECSPTGWRSSKNYQGVFTLWIPDDCLNATYLERLTNWAEEANGYIWLNTNKNTCDYFYGDELD